LARRSASGLQADQTPSRNSSINGGINREKAVRAVTLIAILTNAMPTISQP
jgi:hypothetical protein